MEKVGKTGSEITKNVDELVRQFRTIPDDLLYDETYMERFDLEKIGLKAFFKVYDLGIEKRSKLLVVS